MHVALAYDRDTQDQAQRLLDWITQLGEVPPLIVCRENDADNLVLPEGATEILYIDHVRHYPESKNLAFQGVAGYMNDVVKQPYLYLEPDCVPTRATWWQEIQDEYQEKRRPFLGPLVPAVRNEKTHMAAIAVYPHDLVKFGAGPALNAHEEVFVTAIAGNVVRQMFATKLIAHDWQGTLQPNDFALYHPDRDGSILESLSDETPSRIVEQEVLDELNKGGDAKCNAPVDSVPDTQAVSTSVQFTEQRSNSDRQRSIPAVASVNGGNSTPWADKLETEQAIVSLVRELKRYCTRPAYVRHIRRVLKSEKVTK